MAVTDLTGTTWLINESVSPSPYTGFNPSISVHHVSNGNTYTGIMMSVMMGTLQTVMYTGDSNVNVYTSNGWVDQAYRTVNITGGVDVTSANAIAWFENNAVQQITVDDVVISYNGSDIASMTESGTKTLETDGKLCLSDIVVTYTKPSAPSGGGSSNIITFYTPT